MKRLSTIVPAALLFTLVNCGGGSSDSAPPAPAKASALAYVDATSGTYQLKKNAALSTPGSHLVLELWGPAGTTGSGATVTLTVDATKATWANVAPGDAAATYVANGTTFALGAGAPILKAKVTGGTLVATVAEKGLTAAKALNGPLLRVALDLKAGTGTVVDTPIALSADAAKCQVLLADGSMPAVTVALGVLKAQ